MGTRKKFRVNRPDFQHKRQSSLDSLARKLQGNCKDARTRRRKIPVPWGGGRGRYRRGRYGRGQGGPYKPISNGRKPEVGAYLDLPRRQAIDPESLLKWLECLTLSRSPPLFWTIWSNILASEIGLGNFLLSVLPSCMMISESNSS